MKWLLPVVVLFAGCAGVGQSSFQAVDSRRAVVEWRIGWDKTVLNAEFIQGDGDSARMVVSADRPLLVLTRTGGRWKATGVFVRGGWSGTWNTAPVQIAGWLTLAEAVEAGRELADGSREVRTGRMSVRYVKSGGALRNLELACVATDDRFRVIF